MDDRELMRQFACEGSQEAFRVFVERNADWVYCTCQRRLGDAGLAEDATQAVFLAAAQKARSLCRERAIGPWLHRAARYAVAGIQRERARRVRREKEVAAVKDESAPLEAQWAELKPLVEPAMDRLAAVDRQAIVMRFFQKMSHAEIAGALKISEAAAQKRLGRALERLREQLGGSGATFSVAGIAALLTEHAVGPAPAGLVTLIGGSVSAACGGKLAVVVKAIVWRLVMAKAIVYAGAAVVLCLLGGVGFILTNSRNKSTESETAPGPALAIRDPARTASSAAGMGADGATPLASELPTLLTRLVTSTDTNLPALPRPRIRPLVAEVSALPVKFGNRTVFTEGIGDDDRGRINVDSSVRRSGGEAAGHIQLTSALSIFNEASRSFALPAEPLRGKRIVLSGWFKSRDVANHARLRLGIWDNDNNLLIEGSTAHKEPITGTTDWRPYKIVADVPRRAAIVVGTVSLAGEGEIWVDGLQVDAALPGEETTDDQQWHLYSPTRPDYQVAEDATEVHEGHSTVLISSTKQWLSQDAFCLYHKIDRAIQDKVGKRVRVSMWMKYENVTGSVGSGVYVWGADQRVIAREDPGRVRARGTGDWRLFTAEVDIPSEAKYIDYRMIMNYGGKVWLDRESVKYEVVEKEN